MGSVELCRIPFFAIDGYHIVMIQKNINGVMNTRIHGVGDNPKSDLVFDDFTSAIYVARRCGCCRHDFDNRSIRQLVGKIA